MIICKDRDTGKVITFKNVKAVLKEINRDRSSAWTPYDRTDWREGWNEWCEGNYYNLIGIKTII